MGIENHDLYKPPKHRQGQKKVIKRIIKGACRDRELRARKCWPTARCTCEHLYTRLFSRVLDRSNSSVRSRSRRGLRGIRLGPRAGPLLIPSAADILAHGGYDSVPCTSGTMLIFASCPCGAISDVFRSLRCGGSCYSACSRTYLRKVEDEATSCNDVFLAFARLPKEMSTENYAGRGAIK